MPVTRFLVSGTDDQLSDLHLEMCFAMNLIERRKQTLFYTCMAEDRDNAVSAAKSAGVTMQEMDTSQEPKKFWNVVVQGDFPAWEPNAPSPPVRSRGLLRGLWDWLCILWYSRVYRGCCVHCGLRKQDCNCKGD